VDALVFIGLGVVMGLLGRAILPPTALIGAGSAAIAGLVGGLVGGVLGDRHLGGARFSLQPTALILCVVGALVAVAAIALLNARRAHA
jgi:uncharacterized membrane protein YeaQ/YmgE (transglycosylase-associated protein family)